MPGRGYWNGSVLWIVDIGRKDIFFSLQMCFLYIKVYTRNRNRNN